MFSRSDIVRPLTRPPVFLEALGGNGRKIARPSPGQSRIQPGGFYQGMKSLQESPGRFGQTINSRPVHDESKQLKGQLLAENRLLHSGIAPIMKEMMMQVDFDRADFGASPAKGAGVGKVAPLLQAPQMWRDYRADRAGISCAIGVSAD